MPTASPGNAGEPKRRPQVVHLLRCLRLAFALCLSAAALTSAHAATRHEPVALPSAVEGWHWDGQEVQYDARTVFDYIDGAGELFLAYGFEQLSVRRFEQPGQPPLTIECYRMSSSEAAYGVFSFERQGEGIGIGQGSEQGGGLVRFWQGPYFVSLFADGDGAAVDAALLQLGRLAAAALGSPGPLPAVVGLLPGADAGLIPTSVRYVTTHILLNQRLFLARDNILGLTRENGAALAQYGQGADAARLLVVRYPTAAEARAAASRLLAVALPAKAAADRGQTPDGRWILLRQHGTVLAVVIGARTEAAGEALLTATAQKERSIR